MSFAIIFPTKSEAKYFNNKEVDIYFCGVGIAATTYITTKIISENKYDVLILAGIAGRYPNSNYKIGDTVIVSREYEADLGFFFEDGFKHLSDMDLVMDFPVANFLENPYTKKNLPLPLASSNTMNCAIAPFVKTDGIDIENMEGSGFFYACLEAGQEFYEVRSISNDAIINHDDWDYESSIKNMTEGLNKLIAYLSNE